MENQPKPKQGLHFTLLRMSNPTIPQVANVLRTFDQMMRAQMVEISGTMGNLKVSTNELQFPDLGNTRTFMTALFTKESRDVLATIYEVWLDAVGYHIDNFEQMSDEEKQKEISKVYRGLTADYLGISYTHEAHGPKVESAYYYEDVYFRSAPRMSGNSLFPFPEVDLAYTSVKLYTKETHWPYPNHYQQILEASLKEAA